MFLKEFGYVAVFAVLCLAALVSAGCDGGILEKAAEVTNETAGGIDEGQFANGGQTDRIAPD